MNKESSYPNNQQKKDKVYLKMINQLYKTQIKKKKCQLKSILISLKDQGHLMKILNPYLVIIILTFKSILKIQWILKCSWEMLLKLLIFICHNVDHLISWMNKNSPYTKYTQLNQMDILLLGVNNWTWKRILINYNLSMYV